MKKREFLKVSGIITAGAMVSPLITSCGDTSGDSNQSDAPAGLFSQPELGFDYAALEPNIDARTMEIHYSKHHAGYTKKFNAALQGNADFANQTVEEILANLKDDNASEGIRNNGGGFYNHSLFWSIMAADAGGTPQGDIANAINASFGSFEAFQDKFSEAAATVFGSGWAWLCKDDENKLFITSTPNQDNPLMGNIVEQSGTPILGIDVWEHAYYLNYQNERKKYIGNFFNVINWKAVEGRLVG